MPTCERTHTLLSRRCSLYQRTRNSAVFASCIICQDRYYISYEKDHPTLPCPPSSAPAASVALCSVKAARGGTDHRPNPARGRFAPALPQRWRGGPPLVLVHGFSSSS